MMKKLWLPLMIVSVLTSAFCVFYVAVGATAAEEEEGVPEGVFESSEDQKELRARETALVEKPAEVYSMEQAQLPLSLLCRGYDNGRIYEMDYTVKDAYFSDTLPDGVEAEKLKESDCHNMGVLQEGYTFLCVDVIIENKDENKQMYIVNSASVSGYSLLGFLGQEFKNSAILHAELYPEKPFETTLVFAVRTDRNEAYQLYINNFGYGSPNGTCAYIDLEIEK